MKVDVDPQSAAEYHAAALYLYVADWYIWRSSGIGGQPAAWCATRRARNDGEPKSIHRDTARELAIKLAEDTRRAQLREQFARNPGGA